MNRALLLDLTWLVLVVLTLGGAYLGEFASSGFWTTLVIALITAVKGRLVIDRFMGSARLPSSFAGWSGVSACWYRCSCWWSTCGDRSLPA